MRTFLTDLHIVGGVGVWSEGEICRHAIENLLTFCDEVVICMDNSDVKTKGIVMEYANKYPDKIIVGETGLPPLEDGEFLMARHKRYEGQIIQACLDIIREKVHAKRKIDILAFIDSDEVFTDTLPQLMEEFWSRPETAVLIKPIEVYGSEYVISSKGLMSHGKLYKYVPEISSVPYHKQNFYAPYSKNRSIIKRPWTFVHLARLTEENRNFRAETRKRPSDPTIKLRRVSKPARTLTPAEAEMVDLSPKFIRLSEWNGNIDEIPLVL